jgi:hypothetical protein
VTATRGYVFRILNEKQQQQQQQQQVEEDDVIGRG